MTARQDHGFIYQNLMTIHHGFTSLNGRVDFLKDPITGLAVQFKTHKEGTVSAAMSGLSGTIEIFGPNEQPFTLSILEYEPTPYSKIGKILTEYSIDPTIHSKAILGCLTPQIAIKLNQLISIKNHKEPSDAREEAKKQQVYYKPNLGLLQLNPKIDSGVQRRWQCSLNLRELRKLVPWVEHKDYYRKIRLFEICN